MGVNDAAFAIGVGVVVATVATLIALIGLSAFQSRRHPLLTWAAFAIPCVGAVVGLLGWVAIDGGRGQRRGGRRGTDRLGHRVDRPARAGPGLVAVRARHLAHAEPVAPRVRRSWGSAPCSWCPRSSGVTGGLLPTPAGEVLVVASLAAFPLGWVALGLSALRIDRPAASAAAAA